MTQRLTNCRVFDGEQVINDCDVVLAGGVIKGIVAKSDAIDTDCELHDLGGNLLAPGLIDLQVNGGGGVLFNDAPSVASLHAIAAAHRGYGTTAFLPTLITDSEAVMDEAIAAVADAIREAEAEGLGEFEMPTATWGAKFLATPFGDSLIPHAMFEPGGMTAEMGAAFLENDVERIATEGAKVLAEQEQANTEFREGIDTARRDMREQLVSAGMRPDQDVNRRSVHAKLPK